MVKTVSYLQNLLLSVRFFIGKFCYGLVYRRVHTIVSGFEVHLNFVCLEESGEDFLGDGIAVLLRQKILVHFHCLLGLTLLKCYLKVVPAYIKALMFLILDFLLSCWSTFLFLKMEGGAIF